MPRVGPTPYRSRATVLLTLLPLNPFPPLIPYYLRYLDEKTCHNPRNDIPSASGSMVADVLTLLTVFIMGSAVLLA